MNVLVVTPQPPYPPMQGAALRNFAIVRHLARRHAVSLLSFADGQDEFDEAEPRHCRASEGAGILPERGTATPPGSRAELLRYCRRVDFVPAPRRRLPDRLHTLLATPLPDMAVRLASTAFGRRLGEMLAETAFDVVQFEGIELAPYLLGLPRRTRPALVLDEHNAEYLLQRRTFAVDRWIPRRFPGALYSLVQWRRLASYERAACRHADAVIAVSPADRRALLALEPTLDVRSAPNGVDVDAFPLVHMEPPEPSLVFIGTMHYRPNVDAVVWFCDEVLPRVASAVPAVQLTIVGRDPAPAVLRLRSPRVAVTGTVSDDLPYLVGATVCVVPMRAGGGIRFKILQAMAAGVPVVTTRLGAEGIDVHDGIHCSIAEDAESFAGAVVDLLRNPARRQPMATAARAFVAQHFDWSVTLSPLDDLYSQLGVEQSTIGVP